MKIQNFLVVIFLGMASWAQGAVMTWYGPAGGPVAGWDNGSDSIEWTAVPSLDSSISAGLSGELDFVGDSQNSGFYLAENASFLFFRMRVNVGTVVSNTFSGAHLILIDVVDWNYPVGGETGKPDFSIAWDSKSNDPTKHGLEMQIPDTLGSTWGGVKMDDIDGDNGKKIAPPDINTTGQGYVRTIDGQATANFGTTTFIDYAVSLSYLSSNSDLANIRTHPLRFQLGSISNATDHNLINADVAGGFTLDSIVTESWSATIPEPSGFVLVGSAFALSCFHGLRRRREGRPTP